MESMRRGAQSLVMACSSRLLGLRQLGPGAGMNIANVTARVVSWGLVVNVLASVKGGAWLTGGRMQRRAQRLVSICSTPGLRTARGVGLVGSVLVYSWRFLRKLPGESWSYEFLDRLRLAANRLRSARAAARGARAAAKSFLRQTPRLVSFRPVR